MRIEPKQKILANAFRVGFFGSLGSCLGQFVFHGIPLDPLRITIQAVLVFVLTTALYFFWGLIRGSN